MGLGSVAEWRLRTSRDLTMASGLVTVALAWLAGTAILSVPLYLSGHFASFTDAYYDAMSGLTTSGLALIQDLDHVTVPINLLRHLTHFAGGQGIVVVVLTMLASGGARIGTLYLGEGRDDRIVPNVVRTARFIYLIATAYLLVGSFSPVGHRHVRGPVPRPCAVPRREPVHGRVRHRAGSPRRPPPWATTTRPRWRR